MGIQSLLPFLEKSTRSCHVSEFRGGTVTVDSYCWLHRGAYCCAEQLVRGEKTDQHVQYCLKFVKMLLSYDIKPIMVFDGRHLPAKLQTEEKRRQERKNARKQAVELLSLGKTEEAHKYFQRCVDINPQMALALIKECRKLNVDCIVAPYESDAQLAYFNVKGVAEVVITEDSDLLLFGCKKVSKILHRLEKGSVRSNLLDWLSDCLSNQTGQVGIEKQVPHVDTQLQVLFKMDVNGNGQLVESDKINLSMKMSENQYTFDKFRHMCILSGCDYVSSLPGIGLKKAHKFVTMTAETNPELFLDKVPRYLNLRRQLTVDAEYREKFLVADATFRHQTVFDPFTKKLVPLNDVESAGTKIDYCKNAGEIFDHKDALELAMGNLNPLTMERIDSWKPDSSSLDSHSIWSNNFQVRHSRKQTVKTQICERPIVKKTESVKADEILEYKETIKKELTVYRKSTTFVKKTESVETDNADDYDAILKKELEIYKRSPAIEKPDKEQEENCIDSPTSPILGKYSKIPFKKNVGLKNVIIKSRFFSSEPAMDDSIDLTPTEYSSSNISIMKESESQLTKLESGDSETGTNSDRILNPFKITNSLKEPGQSTVQTLTLVDETITTTDCKLESGALSSVENIINKPQTTTATTTATTSQIQITRKAVTKSTSVKRKGQKTILDMFKRMKSC